MQTASRPARLAWSVCACCLVLLALALLLVILGWPASLPQGFVPWPGQAIAVVGAAGIPVLAGLVASRRPENPYGWVWCGFGLAHSVLLTSRAYMSVATAGPELPARPFVAVLGDVGWVLWLALIPFVLLLFPTGALPSRRWRWVARTSVLGGILVLGAGMFAPRLAIVPLENPLAAPDPWGERLLVLADVGVYLVFASIIASAASLIPRYRAATETERRQLAWFGYAAAVIALSFAIDPFLQLPDPWDAVHETTALGVLYVAIGIAILRHGLYDIDRVINRTLVYGTLTACLLATYVLVVGYLGSVFRVQGNAAVSLAATGLVAVLFAPLRDRLQQAVNRLMYGQRADPYAVVSQLGRRLESALAPEAVLPTIVESIAQALKLPQVEIWFTEGPTIRLGAVHGHAPAVSRVGGATELSGVRGIALVLTLTHRGQTVGALCVAPRHTGAGLSRADRRLLRDLATQVGPATHAVGLTAELRSRLNDLRRSRERLVAAQQEERLRIHRDLHDGLGPVLASIRLRLEACLDSVPQTAPALTADLERLHELVGRATADIRTLVHDLHPPELAQLGLVGTLHQHCDRVSRETGIDVRFEASPDLCAPPATQVALLRIAQEALVNVDKHAGADRVEVRLEECGTELRLSIRDDGVGLDEERRGDGAGIASMQTRSELLGGTLQLGGGPWAGTLVTARIPVKEVDR